MILLDAYQQRVSDCLQSVESSHDVDVRTAWRELALCWLRLSDHAEQFRRKATHSEGIRARPDDWLGEPAHEPVSH
jgi:hypothetical protein